MTWVRSIAIGLGVGALVGVTPLELSPFVLLGVVASLWSPLELARKGPSLAPLRHAALRFALIAGLALLASQLPFKHFDQRTTLDSSCLTVAAAAKAGHWLAIDLAPEVLERTVCAPSSAPTLRELRSALEKSGVEVRQGYCGNGATLLWGAHPMSGILEARR